MPMPKLLKKLSRKSLRGHDSEHESESGSPPPLPLTEYDAPDDNGRTRTISFTPPYALPTAKSSRESLASQPPAPHRTFSTGSSSVPSASSANSTFTAGAQSRQTSQMTSLYAESRKSYAPNDTPRSRTTSYAGSRPASSYVVEGGDAPNRSPSRSRMHAPSPSQLGVAAFVQPPTITGRQLTASPSGSPQPRAASPAPAPDDELSRSLAGAWEIANTAPKVSKVDKALLVVENNFTQAQAKEAKGMAIVAGVETALTTLGGMEAIEAGIHSVMDGIPVLMNALDEVAKLHPFIGVAVLAFKAVWSLEQKRRSNDKMIISLHVEMKDMMAVLTQLKNVKDAEEIAPDGSTIRGRMQEIVKNTADDIKSCANTCDTYTKKRTIVKVLKGPIWEGKLTSFVGVFTKRRGEFEFALSIHTAQGVDAANRAISAVDKTTQEMNAKMDMMMKFFQQAMAPEHREMARLVEQRGGLEACQDNDKVLRELNELESKSVTQVNLGPTSSKGSASGSGSKSGLEDLKDELTQDIDAALEKNLAVFSRKLEVQTRQIIDEMSKVVERQGDRIIQAVTAGPHDKILDPTVFQIWKEMAWRGSVKSRYFVMALRDYYTESEGKAEKSNVDDWALPYLTVSRLQSISEAFDDDASGFVTVAEANTFTSSRPLDWSLIKWLAMWAIGWHQSMSRYATKIRELLAKMYAVALNALPANRVAVNKYLETIYQGVTTLHSGLNPCYINESLQEKFNSYFDSEEARLRGNLEAVQYDIDALNTFYLVAGNGRVEKFLLPLIYLLLERHFQIMRACQTRQIHPDELWDAADTLNWAILAARDRVDVLESTFKQQKVDTSQQFKTFAHGLFQYLHEPAGLWDPKIVLAQDDIEYPYDDSLEDQHVDFSKILNYPLDTEQLDFDAYKPPVRAKKGTSHPASGLKTILGTWNGYTYSTPTSVVPSVGMISMELIATGNLTFTASSRANMSNFTITGECTPQNVDTVNFKFKQSFPTRYAPLYFSGSWDSTTQALSGTWGEEADARTHPGVFLFKRTAPESMRFFPAPTVLQADREKALWKFAIAAVRYGVRKAAWSWDFFEQRAEGRKRFIELYIRDTRFGRPLGRSEEEELGMLKKSFTVADSRWYHSIAEREIRLTTDHDVSCDACKGYIGGTRVTCLTCRLEETFDTVDFCNSPSCMSVKVVPSGLTKPHLPTHDILKVRRVVHIGQFGKTYRQAQEALKRSRTFFPDPAGDGQGVPSRKSLRPPPQCKVCRRNVKQPCWFCVQCQEPSFICNTCEAKKTVSFGNHDMDMHDLVRCQPLVESGETLQLEERLADIEARFEKNEAHMDKKLQELEVKMGERWAQVDQRLFDMERLLRILVATMGSKGAAATPVATSPTAVMLAAAAPPSRSTSSSRFSDPYMYNYP